VLSIEDYENLLHQHHLNLELTDEYKLMIDGMIEQEKNGQIEYKSFQEIKSRFLNVKITNLRHIYNLQTYPPNPYSLIGHKYSTNQFPNHHSKR